MSSTQPTTEASVPTIAVRMTERQLLALTDALAFSAQFCREVHGTDFITDLHWKLLTIRRGFCSASETDR